MLLLFVEIQTTNYDQKHCIPLGLHLKIPLCFPVTLIEWIVTSLHFSIFQTSSILNFIKIYQLWMHRMFSLFLLISSKRAKDNCILGCFISLVKGSFSLSCFPLPFPYFCSGLGISFFEALYSLSRTEAVVKPNVKHICVIQTNESIYTSQKFEHTFSFSVFFPLFSVL